MKTHSYCDDSGSDRSGGIDRFLRQGTVPTISAPTGSAQKFEALAVNVAGPVILDRKLQPLLVPEVGGRRERVRHG